MSRHQARETAFKMIFQMDVGKNPLEIAERTLEEAVEDKAVKEEERRFIMSLAAGVDEKREELNALIEPKLKGWTLKRLSKVRMLFQPLGLWNSYILTCLDQ